MKKRENKKAKKPFLNHRTEWLAIGGIFVLAMFFFSQNASFLNASILPIQAPKPYDGIVYPVKYVPNWSKLTSEERKMDFDQIPKSKIIEIPEYKASELTVAFDNLVFGDNHDDEIRNAKITYSVPYLGNYKLDGKENAGSHPAVDIKIPMNTPLYSIGNGVVIKAAQADSGFGKVVVIKHTNFPSLDDPTPKYEIYSGYGHMNRIDVRVGDIVEKGQQIGLSGNSGFATTPHIHFQIDNDKAPWHPYWPFTYKEAADAGLDFVGALNAGIGQAQAAEMTVHPLLYVQKYLSESSSNATQNEVVPTSNPTPTPTATPLPTSTPQPSTTPSPEATPSPEVKIETPAPSPSSTPVIEEKEPTKDVNKVSEFEVILNEYTLLESNFTAYISAKDVSGKLLSAKEVESEVLLEVENPEIADLNRRALDVSDFVEGVAPVVVIPKNVGDTRLVLTHRGNKYYSDSFSVIKQVNYATKIEIQHDGKFIPGIPEKLTLSLLDKDGNPTPETPLGTVELSSSVADAEFSSNKFSFSNFKNGKFEVELVANANSDIEITARGGSIFGKSELRSDDAIFTDVSYIHPNYNAIKYFRDNGVINGYNDGSFKPDNKISRAELVKIIINAFEIEKTAKSNAFFRDVDPESWYAPYVFTASALDIVGGYKDGSFQPAKTINRAEFLKILTLTAKSPLQENVEENPFKDVSVNSWFAKYAEYVKRTNTFPVSGNFLEAEKDLTRAEAAEAIYRILMLKENNLEKFSA